ncbi:hypothetical protein AVEN_153134-1, partial [Araneus ventricosus]
RQLDVVHEPTHPQEIESKQRIRLESLPRKAKTREDMLWGRTRYSALCADRKNFVTVAKGATPQVTANKKPAKVSRHRSQVRLLPFGCSLKRSCITTLNHELYT